MLPQHASAVRKMGSEFKLALAAASVVTAAVNGGAVKVVPQSDFSVCPAENDGSFREDCPRWKKPGVGLVLQNSKHST
jgi:hypothetical protein